MTSRPSRPDIAARLRSLSIQKDPNEALKTEAIIIDDLLETEVGPCGIWQWLLVILAILSTTGASTFPVFADSVPLRRCDMGEEWEAAFARNNLTFEQIGLLTGGWSRGESMESLHAGCQRFSGRWDNATIPDVIDPNTPLTSVPDLSNQTIPCPNGYVYTYQPFQYNGGVVETFDMVCEKSWFIPVGTSVFMIGMMLGYLLCGFWGAKFGLKHALISFSMLELISSGLCSLSHQFWLYTLLRFLVSIGAYGKLSSFNIILLELTVPRYRSLVNAAYLLGFNGTSRAFLSLFSYLLRDWRWLSLAATSHCVLVFTYFWLVPESPRWLLTQGRPIEAIDVLEHGRKVNMIFKSDKDSSDILTRLSVQHARRPSRISVTIEEIDTALKMGGVGQKKKRTTEMVMKLFASIKMIKTTIISTMIFFLFAFIFIGLLLYMRMIRQPVYLVSLIIAAAAVPGAIIAIVAYRVIKHRRAPLACVYAVAAITLCIGGVYTYMVQPEGDLPLSITLVLAIMLMVTSQSMMFIYVPELYPPEVRSQGFGTSAGLGRLGSAITTFVNQLDYTTVHGVPVIIYAVVALTAGLLTMCLDDTTGEEEPAPLDPDQIKELEGNKCLESINEQEIDVF